MTISELNGKVRVKTCYNCGCLYAHKVLCFRKFDWYLSRRSIGIALCDECLAKLKEEVVENVHDADRNL